MALAAAVAGCSLGPAPLKLGDVSLDASTDRALLCQVLVDPDLAALVRADLGKPVPGVGSGDLDRGEPWAYCMARDAESEKGAFVGVAVFPAGFVSTIIDGVDEFCDGAAGEPLTVGDLVAAELGCIDHGAYATLAAARVTEDAALVITSRQPDGSQQPTADELTAALREVLEQTRDLATAT